MLLCISNMFKLVKSNLFLAVCLLLVLAPICIIISSKVQASQLASCSQLPTNLGIVTMEINAPSSATYRLWSRIIAPTKAQSSFYVQLDNDCSVKIGGNLDSSKFNKWTWIDYKNGSTADKADFKIKKGKHTLKIAGDVTGLGLDKITLLKNDCVPNTNGENLKCIKISQNTASPSGLTAASPSDSKAILEWKSVPGATKYNVYILEEDDKGSFNLKKSTSDYSISFSDLNSNEAALFYVTSVINGEESPKSDTVRVNIK